MKQDNKDLKDTINFFDLLEKLKNNLFVLIVLPLIFTLIGFIYSMYSEQRFKVEVKISEVEKSEMLEYNSLNYILIDLFKSEKILNDVKIDNTLITSKRLLNHFVSEFRKYEVLSSVFYEYLLSNNEIESIDTSNKSKEIAGSFEIVYPSKRNKYHYITFETSQVEEYLNILNVASLKINELVKNLVFEEINNNVDILKKSNEAKIILEKNKLSAKKGSYFRDLSSKKSYLEEQLKIAKELNINKPVDIILFDNLSNDSEIEYQKENYYYDFMRGTISLNVEIDSLEKRIQNKNQIYDKEYFEIQETLHLLELNTGYDEVLKILNKIENVDLKSVEIDMNQLKIVPLSSKLLTTILFFATGLLFALIYIFLILEFMNYRKE